MTKVPQLDWSNLKPRSSWKAIKTYPVTKSFIEKKLRVAIPKNGKALRFWIKDFSVRLMTTNNICALL